MAKITTIIFDMGGVLFDFNPRLYISRLGLPKEDNELLAKAIYGYKWILLDYGYYESEEDFLTDVCKQLPERLHEAARTLVLRWEYPAIVPIEGTADIVRSLKEKGYRILLLSNAGPRHHEYWPKIPGSEFFDGLVVSAYEKKYKPCRDIYLTLLERYNLKGEECVFIDDLSANCAGAFLCGINPIRFLNAEDLRLELAKLGVVC